MVRNKLVLAVFKQSWWQFLLIAAIAAVSTSRQGLRLSELISQAREDYDRDHDTGAGTASDEV